jgi:hypothetical protein
VRRTPALLAAAALIAVGLVGCSSAPAPSACPAPSSALNLIQVSGDLGSEPRVEVNAPFHADSTAGEVVSAGDGLVFSSEDQTALLDVAVYSGETGDPLVSTSFTGDIASTPSLAQLSQTFPGLGGALECATEGSRVAVAMAPDGIAPEAVASLGLSEGESAVLVVDLRKVYLAKADGADQFVESRGLPTVVRAPDGRPGIIVPDTDAPDDLVVQVLKRGDGAEVTGDAPVRVAYTGIAWGEDEPFDSSWGKEPLSVDLESVVPGFADALRGQTVGSQILAVIPPDQGYGDADQGAIPGGSTLVFVIDILGLDD